jgi:hypothetical protein
MFAYRAQLRFFRSLSALVLLVGLAGGLVGMAPGRQAPAGPVPGCLQPPDGLVAWWPLDRQFGVVTFELIGGYNGHSVSAPALVPARVSGGFQFDGVDDWVVTDLNSISSPALTIDAWIWVDSLTGSQMDIVSEDLYWLGVKVIGSAYYFAAHLVDSGGEITVNGSTPVQPHTWYHVAVSFADSQAMRLYVNAIEVNNKEIASLVPPLGDFLIAASFSEARPENFFNGIIDEVEIFNRVLDITEIQAIYLAGPAGKCKCLPSAPGLVSWWPGDGHARDIFGSNHGTLVNGVSYWYASYVGLCFGFDGADDFVQVPDSPGLNPASALTLNAWVNVETFSANYMDIAGKDPEVGTSRSYLLNVVKDGSHGHFRAHLTTVNSGFKYVTGNVEVNRGIWYHVAMTYDGAMLRLYVNGVEDGSTPMTGMIVSNNGPFRIGGGAPPGQDQLFFGGWIEEVQLHNVALSAGEIQEISSYLMRGQCKLCQVYLPLMRRN